MPAAHALDQHHVADEVIEQRVAAGAVEPEDFSLEKHRRIFARMKDLYERGEKIDRLTVANELMKQGQLESIDGFSYLASLDEGLPSLANLDSYIRIVKDNGGIAYAQQKMLQFRDDALDILNTFDSAELKYAMEDLVRFTTDRSF